MFPRLIALLLIFVTFPSFAAYKLSSQEVTTLFQSKNKDPMHNANQWKQNHSSLFWKGLSQTQRRTNDLKIVAMTGSKLILFAFQPRSEGLIYKSIDGGKHWTSVSVPHVWHLYDVLPLDENRLLIATDNTIFISSDFGEHWQTWSTLEDNQFEKLFSFDGKIIFSYQWGNIDNPNTSGFFRTVDNGHSWVPVNLGLSPMFGNNYILKGNQKMLLTNRDQSGLYFSIDNGNRWQQPKIWKDHSIDHFVIDNKNNIYVVSKNKLYKTNGVTYFDEISIVEDVLLLSLDTNNTLYVLTENKDKIKKLYCSKDTATHWQLIYEVEDDTNVNAMIVLDNHNILLTTDKDFILSDQTQTKFTRITLPQSIVMKDMDKILVLDDQFFLSTLDFSGKLYITENAGKTWRETHLEDPTIQILDVAIWNHQIVVLTHRYGDKEIGLYLSKDKTKSFIEIRRFANATQSHLKAENGGLFINLGQRKYFSRDLIHFQSISTKTYYLANYYDGKTLYVSNGNWVKSSKDDGFTWTTLLDSLNSYATTITGYQENGENGILIAMSQAGILKTTDGGTSWTLFNQGLNYFSFNDLLAIDAAHYILATNDGIFYSQDAGETWQKENQGLSSIQISSLAMSHKIILACTKHGIFTTLVE